MCLFVWGGFVFGTIGECVAYCEMEKWMLIADGWKGR